MARDTTDDTPIEDTAALAAWVAEGEKPPEAFRIGTEHEKFGFLRDTLMPAPYDGPSGIAPLLRGMEVLLGWEPILDGEAIIGLVDPVGGGAISLEPGGQFELSGAPLENLHQTCREANAHLAQVRQIAEPLGLGFLGIGVAPTWSYSDMPRMPKQRYEIMTNYMPKVGSRGLDMMYRTATIQVNLDYASEADMVKKLRVGLALQPVATALFADSPFLDGKPNGFLSYRSEIWRDTDPDRTGMMPFAFDEGFGYEAYVDWCLDVPMYFVKRGGSYIDVTGHTFREFMEGRLPHLPGELPTIGDWTNHLSTIFPEVRLKRFLEMRGADGGPWRRICAVPALWVGLLYDEGVLDQAWEMVKDWTAEERQAARDSVPRLGLKAEIAGRPMLDVARDVLDLSREGLKRRARMNSSSSDETQYLAPLEEVVALGRTMAERMLDLYEGPWQGKLDQIFTDYAF
ncbi:glutamate--cysteine ligase [Amorphus orientalis]|uniref:Glutamate--cysteine ligase n=1 Tax=Amorphus orientalis TaxID=649198 RepID=A0AAE3VPP1_9HYPH|nr:glutamate--cysteine ligase [Amorphus orientalis]MDQ0316539.1 glutamate--cysteine ligase [Amorphus orientalis]